jgi:hypothetical protein
MCRICASFFKRHTQPLLQVVKQWSRACLPHRPALVGWSASDIGLDQIRLKLPRGRRLKRWIHYLNGTLRHRSEIYVLK